MHTSDKTLAVPYEDNETTITVAASQQALGERRLREVSRMKSRIGRLTRIEALLVPLNGLLPLPW